MKRNLIILGSIVVAALTLITFWPVSTSTIEPKPVPPCSTAEHPCIKIVDEQGKEIARINDFRFGNQGCIWYRMNVGDMWQLHCGGYNMIWIGSGNPPGHESKI